MKADPLIRLQPKNKRIRLYVFFEVRANIRCGAGLKCTEISAFFLVSLFPRQIERHPVPSPVVDKHLQRGKGRCSELDMTLVRPVATDLLSADHPSPY